MIVKFEALEVALLMVAEVRPVIEVLQKHCGALADQLERAAYRVPLGLGEGADSRKGNKPARYQESLASAGEVMTILRTALALGHVVPRQIESAIAATDRTKAIVWRLVHPRNR